MPVQQQKFIRQIFHIALINFASALIAIIFTVSNYGVKDGFSLRNLIFSLIYGNCIGTLIYLSIIFAASRFERENFVVRLVKITTLIFLATFFGVLLARLILTSFFPQFIAGAIIPDWRDFLFSFGIALTFGYGIYFYELSQTKLVRTRQILREKELAEEKSKTLVAEAQLASLESRIHPHFLFNTLNSIAALIRENPVLAEKMIEKLSALLRYSLDAGNVEGTVFLEKELEITEKYLEIEKVRFGERLNYKIETSGSLEKIKVPSLALQTLVENSVKHVAAKNSRRTEILVSAFQNKTDFIIEVSDNGAGFSAAELKSGHGLDNLQKRLQNIFDENASLEIIKNGAGGKVRLKIPNE